VFNVKYFHMTLMSYDGLQKKLYLRRARPPHFTYVYNVYAHTIVCVYVNAMHNDLQLCILVCYIV
jgi:hypothetical protein